MDLTTKYTIIIPVYNAFEYLFTCLESVLLNTDPFHTILVIDDASTEGDLEKQLESWPKAIQYLKNNKNLGFVKSVNKAISHASHVSFGNVVLLNSDTIVSKNWIEKLDKALNFAPNIGLASPLSNYATLLSVPSLFKYNTLPPEHTFDDINLFLEKTYKNSPPIEIPVGVGFCLAIKKEVIQEIGLFDENFSPGYGEECDYCLSAQRAGFLTVAAIDTYVYHFGSKSFGDTTSFELKKINEEKMAEKWPKYKSEITEFYSKNPLRHIQETINTLYRPKQKKNVLEVLHTYNTIGGTEQHTKQIMEELKDKYKFTVVYPGGFNRDIPGNPRICYLWWADKDRLSQMLSGNYDIVHFQHTLNWRDKVVDLVKEVKNHPSKPKIVISLHDLYFLKTPEVFDLVDLIIVPSLFIKQKLPEGQLFKTVLVPHGIKPFKNRPPRGPGGGLLRVAFLGAFCRDKGALHFLEVVRLVKEKDLEDKFEFHIIGQADTPYLPIIKKEKIKYTGRYHVNSLPELTKDIDVILILSQVEESFCLTLSEAQALGIPVICTRKGAMPERMSEQDRGTSSPEETLEILKKYLDEKGNLDYRKVRPKGEKIITIKSNANVYSDLYEKVLLNETVNSCTNSR